MDERQVVDTQKKSSDLMDEQKNQRWMDERMEYG
jgi:hypothetical protein